MALPLPPIKNAEKLAREIELVCEQDRDDAIQEAWLAHAEGRDPIQAVKTYAVREYRLRERRVPIVTDADGDDAALEHDGTRKLPARQETESSVGTVRRNSLAKAG
jgi:hypothetical protein